MGICMVQERERDLLSCCHGAAVAEDGPQTGQCVQLPGLVAA